MNHTLKLAVILYFFLLACMTIGWLLYRYANPLFVSFGIIIVVIALDYLLPQCLRLFSKAKPYQGAARDRILALAKKQRVEFKECEITSGKSLGAAAFGFGNNRTFVLSQGMAETFSREELEAVAAHEIGHLAHYDPHIYAGIVAVVALFGGVFNLATSPSTLAIGILLLPFVLVFPVTALSRGHEFEADHYAAVVLGLRDPLASGFKKAIPILEAEGANMTAYAWWEKILAFHPSFSERIQAIEKD